MRLASRSLSGARTRPAIHAASYQKTCGEPVAGIVWPQSSVYHCTGPSHKGTQTRQCTSWRMRQRCTSAVGPSTQDQPRRKLVAVCHGDYCAGMASFPPVQLLRDVAPVPGVVLPAVQAVQLRRRAAAVPVADHVPAAQGKQLGPPKPARQAACGKQAGDRCKEDVDFFGFSGLFSARVLDNSPSRPWVVRKLAPVCTIPMCPMESHLQRARRQQTERLTRAAVGGGSPDNQRGGATRAGGAGAAGHLRGTLRRIGANRAARAVGAAKAGTADCVQEGPHAWHHLGGGTRGVRGVEQGA